MYEEELQMLSKEELTKILKDMKNQEEELNPDDPVIEDFERWINETADAGNDFAIEYWTRYLKD